MPPPALLSINKGEKSYKCMNTDWLVDSNGPFMFRFISKFRVDNKVELVFFTQRQDNRKYVLQHISFDKDDFLRVVDAIRQTIWQFFPRAKVEAVDFEDLSPSAYRTVPYNWFGLVWIRLIWYFDAVKNRLQWFFARQRKDQER